MAFLKKIKEVNVKKTNVALLAFNRWVLCMWTTAQILRTMDFAFHRVMAIA